MKLTPEKLSAFCAALAETCNVGKACAAVGISRWTAYHWRKEMPNFAEAWDDAMKAGVIGLEDEAHRRAFEGMDKPLTHLGQFSYLYRDAKDDDGNFIIDEATGKPRKDPVLDEHGNHKIAAVREYSDTLAIFLLKAHAPEKYRENSKVELSGSLALNTMSDEEIRAELAVLTAGGALHSSDDVSDLI
jgi:hypothetical protein